MYVKFVIILLYICFVLPYFSQSTYDNETEANLPDGFVAVEAATRAKSTRSRNQTYRFVPTKQMKDACILSFESIVSTTAHECTQAFVERL